MNPLEPIGTIHSVFKEKFGIPRQAGLITEAKATLILHPPFNRPEAVAGLEAFSHVWLIYIFHAIEKGKWKPTVRPPRLGGNRRTGVFATRSSFRPNPIGLSVVKLDKVVTRAPEICLELSGVDLLDGTPVLDIKPYLPYADAVTGAAGGFAQDAPDPVLSVAFSPAARAVGERLENGAAPGILDLIRQMLALDPRPAYMDESAPDRIYGFRLLDVDVKWKVSAKQAIVIEIHSVS